MKQRITIEQLQELSGEQKDLLMEWWKPSEGDQALCEKYGIITVHKNGDEFEENGMIWINCSFSLMAEKAIPLLSIGQMIQFILETTGSYPDNFQAGVEGPEKQTFVDFEIDPPYRHMSGFQTYSVELCDALWEAVKEII